MKADMWQLPMRRVACAAALGLWLGLAVGAGELTLTWWTVDAGGAVSPSGPEASLSGAIGQAEAGPALTAGDLQLVGGFWAVGGGIPAGDCDADGVVGSADLVILTDCLNGPRGLAGQGCVCADYDGDGDVDLEDFAAATRAFATP